ncbi:unnamed protein product [Rotaria sp. Silwood1]|nr:unnamed protein product [Rotaria sp. Silwood1]CAF1410977.1 unnamed protein product [Rotaria sp. Silwood1]CAF3624428.1 unnamed protein product [Rotaria sp. Silwood1]CAF4687135.1 unnamed protein product [Rotaria sp. Silwood1]
MLKFPSPYDNVLPHQIQVIFPKDLSPKEPTLDRVIGSLVGLAIGDALGASVEFRPHEYLQDNPVTEMQSGGTWGLNAGQWTDDTSMGLCLASSLIAKQCFDPYDQMVRYKWWYKYGFLSSTGQCFDIGDGTREALEEFCHRQSFLKEIYRCKTDEEVDQLPLEKVLNANGFSLSCSSAGAAGNGALMRLAPVPLFYFRSPTEAVSYAGRSAILTHGNIIARDACRYFAALIVAAVSGESKEKLLSNKFYNDHKAWFGSENIHPEVLEVARGSYKQPRGYDDGIRGNGYVVKALEAALWAFYYDQNSFKTGVLAAIQLGDDTDTTAAIYGQLAGAYYGYQNIPENWRRQLYGEQLITSIGHWLHFLGKEKTNTQQQPSMLVRQHLIPTTNSQSQHWQLNSTMSLPDGIEQDTSIVDFADAHLQSYVSTSPKLLRQNNPHGVHNLVDTNYNTDWKQSYLNSTADAGLPRFRRIIKSIINSKPPYHFSKSSHY